MPEPLTAGLAPNLVLTGGYIVRLTALDPATGAVVAGVTVSGASLQVDTPGPETAVPVPPSLPPVVTYGPEAPGLNP